MTEDETYIYEMIDEKGTNILDILVKAGMSKSSKLSYSETRDIISSLEAMNLIQVYRDSNELQYMLYKLTPTEIVRKRKQ